PDVWATGGTAGTLETAARPTLPRRRPQASTIQSPQDPLAGKRRDTPTARGTEPPADQMTGLMAEFLRGVRSAEEEDPSAQDS
ncbi:MAG: hypothetical protein ACRDNW_09725, partial [Trebonia sp.]